MNTACLLLLLGITVSLFIFVTRMIWKDVPSEKLATQRKPKAVKKNPEPGSWQWLWKETKYAWREFFRPLVGIWEAFVTPRKKRK
jgi:hypothetical protein